MALLNIRPFVPGCEAALVDVWFSSWLSAGLDRPVVTRESLQARLPGDLAERWDAVVAELDGKMLGFVAVVLGERRLDQLFVAPEAQGHGIGLRLFEAAREKLLRDFWLSTQPGNARARVFYERRGMKLDRIEADPSGDRAIYVAGTAFPP